MNRLFEIREATLRKLIWYGCDMGAQTQAQKRLTRTVIPRPPRMIHDLPPEIMGEIFKFALATTFSPLCSNVIVNRHLGIRYLSPQTGVMKLVHVCQYWRAIVLSIKALWASMDATYLPPEAWAYWSSFSGSYPLRLQYSPATDLNSFVSLDPRNVNPGDNMTILRERKLERLHEMLRLFAACADRWDALYFDCAYDNIVKAVADMLHTAASRSPLRKLEILTPFQAKDQLPEEMVEKLVAAISAFPSLRDLVWQSTSRSILPLPRALPWHALENVYINVGYEVAVEDCITCLMQCTSAKTFTIHRHSYSRGPRRRTVVDTFKPGHCTLPKLESLTIAERCDPYLLLGYFTLPSLVYLHVHDLIGSAPALQDFLVRSQCPLRTFSALKEVGAFSDEMIGCLSAISYLQSTPNLQIGVYVSAEDYLALVAEKRPDVFDVVPRLTAWKVPLYNGEERHYIGWNDSTEKS